MNIGFSCGLRFNRFWGLIFLLAGQLCAEPVKTLFVPTIYGTFEVSEPVLIDLFSCKAMERVKGVRQYGAYDYVIKPVKEYSRYDHCVGVWALLKLFGAGLEEQIAGLLHDVSHTAFSHTGDLLFGQGHGSQTAYQDSIHRWYLLQFGVDKILEKYGIPVDSVIPDEKRHTMLEQKLPDICADRLEYNLYAGILTKMLTLDEIGAIVKDIRFENGKWFFNDPALAKKFAVVSLFNSEHVWGGPVDAYIVAWLVQAIKRGLSVGVLTQDDIHFSVDDVVWEKLKKSSNEQILACVQKIEQGSQGFVSADQCRNNEPIIKSKFRGIDPLVKTAKGLQRLTEIDGEYKQKFEQTRVVVTRGWFVRALPAAY